MRGGRADAALELVNRAQGSIDDELLIDTTDSDHASGYIGVRTSRSSTSVDNVRVTQPPGC